MTLTIADATVRGGGGRRDGELIMSWTLDAFLRRLDRCDHSPALDELTAMLEDLDVEPEEVRPYVRFDWHAYRRNIMHTGPLYEALVLCWRPGQRTPVHDHGGSTCAMRVLKGVATETAYAPADDGTLIETSRRDLPAGSVSGAADGFVHEVVNDQPPGFDLVTLDVHAPPLVAANTYARQRVAERPRAPQLA